MSEQRLRELLSTDVTAAEREAEERGWAVVKAAYAERTAAPRPRSQRALVLALAGAALLLALLFSPAGAQVRDWIGDVVEGEDDAAASLTSLPTSGELLVESNLGPWIVHQDGSKRLLNGYDSATFSPHGRFLGVTDGPELLAVVADEDATGERVGTPHWTVEAPERISDVAWAPSGLSVAYRSGDELWIVSGNGGEKRVLAGAIAPVPPAWQPLSTREEACAVADGSSPCAQNVLAYVDRGQGLHIVNVDTGRELIPHGGAEFGGAITGLAWSPDGRQLLVLGETFGLVLHPDGTVATKLLSGGMAASFSPTGDAIAVLSHRASPNGIRSEVSVIDDLEQGGQSRRLYAPRGALTDLTWSPDGRWLLTAFPGPDQWIFIRVKGGHHLRAVAGITDEFDAESRGKGGFPRISGWCCAQ
jgi:hypothetical protein